MGHDEVSTVGVGVGNREGIMVGTALAGGRVGTFVGALDGAYTAVKTTMPLPPL